MRLLLCWLLLSAAGPAQTSPSQTSPYQTSPSQTARAFYDLVEASGQELHQLAPLRAYLTPDLYNQLAIYAGQTPRPANLAPPPPPRIGIASLITRAPQPDATFALGRASRCGNQARIPVTVHLRDGQTRHCTCVLLHTEDGWQIDNLVDTPHRSLRRTLRETPTP